MRLLPVAGVFAAATLLGGLLLAWLTSYLFPPLDPKWRTHPGGLFSMGVATALFMAMAGGIVMLGATAHLSFGPWRRARRRLLLWAAAAGALYALLPEMLSLLPRFDVSLPFIPAVAFWLYILGMPYLCARALFERSPDLVVEPTNDGWVAP